MDVQLDLGMWPLSRLRRVLALAILLTVVASLLHLSHWHSRVAVQSDGSATARPQMGLSAETAVTYGEEVNQAQRRKEQRQIQAQNEAPSAEPMQQQAQARAEQKTQRMWSDAADAAAASWSLERALAARIVPRLAYYYGYAPTHSSWNAWPLILPLLQDAGYVMPPGASRPPTNAHSLPLGLLRRGSHDPWKSMYSARPFAGTPPMSRSGRPALIVMPNHWRTGLVEDWRKWALAPYQRINRFWGMDALSKKDRLVETLSTHFGADGGCPFVPRTYNLKALKSSGKWDEVVSSQPMWLIKGNAHRGQGIRMVRREQLLAGHSLSWLMSNPMSNPASVLQASLALPAASEREACRPSAPAL